jgi:hypothetical protein
MKLIIRLFLVVILIVACQGGDTTQLVTIDHKYSVLLPSFLEKSGTTLNEDASLQYLHTWKEFYVIVIDEPKSEIESAIENNQLSDRYSKDIDGYAKLMEEKFDGANIGMQGDDWMPVTINNLSARIKTIRGNSEGVDVFYYFGIIEGKNNYYQVMTWTLAEKEMDYKEQMKNIIYSFKEL